MKGDKGNAILISLFAVTTLLIVGSFFLSSVRFDIENASWQLHRVQAFYLAEAGVNRAIKALGNDLDWTSFNDGSATNNRRGEGDYDWYPLYDGEDVVDVPLGGGRYTVMLRNLPGDPKRLDLKSIGRSKSQTWTIQLRLGAHDRGPFEFAAFGGSGLSVSGSVETDSYNSALGGYGDQTPGQQGNIGSNRDISINGSAYIRGDATPGPGCSVTITGSAVVTGSTEPAPEEFTLKGLDIEFSSDEDLRKSGSSQVTLWDGIYYFDEIRLTGSSELRIEGEVTIYCNSFDQTGSAKLIIEPSASLKVFCRGDFKLAGGGLINYAGRPQDFQLYSTGDEVKLTGGSQFYGAIYAPYAEADLTGNHEFYGSIIVGGTVHSTGSSRYHYDEALKDLVQFVIIKRNVQTISWQEVM